MNLRTRIIIGSAIARASSALGFWLILACSAIAQPVAQTVFKVDSYSLQQPKGWIYKPQSAPGGGTIHMFYGKQEGNALAYCHTTQQPLNANLAPEAAKMNEKQRRDFFLKNSSEDLLLSLHHELATAQGFRQELSTFLASEFPQTKCRVVAVGGRSATIRHEIGIDDHRPGGTVAGPVLMEVADVALYVAILGEIGIVPLAVTTSLTINFMRKPSGTLPTARALWYWLSSPLGLVLGILYSLRREQVNRSLPAAADATE